MHGSAASDPASWTFQTSCNMVRRADVAAGAVALAAVAAVAAGEACDFSGDESYFSRSDVDACLSAVPFNSTWRNDTVALLRAASALRRSAAPCSAELAPPCHAWTPQCPTTPSLTWSRTPELRTTMKWTCCVNSTQSNPKHTAGTTTCTCVRRAARSLHAVFTQPLPNAARPCERVQQAQRCAHRLHWPIMLSSHVFVAGESS